MPEDPTAGESFNAPLSPRRDEPDACGQAALLLAESILHTLIEVDVLTLDQAIAVVRTAAEVKADVAEAAGESRGRMEQSLDLLSAIERSLTIDGDGAANEP